MSRLVINEIKIENPIGGVRELAENATIPQFRNAVAAYSGVQRIDPQLDKNPLNSFFAHDGTISVQTPDTRLTSRNLNGTKWIGTNPSMTDITTSHRLNGFEARHASISLRDLGNVAITTSLFKAGKRTYMGYFIKGHEAEGLESLQEYPDQSMRLNTEKVGKDRAVLRLEKMEEESRLFIAVDEDEPKSQIRIGFDEAGDVAMQIESSQGEEVVVNRHPLTEALKTNGIAVIKVGKSADNDVQWNNPTTSRNHMAIAVIQRAEGLVDLEILDHSSNGTVVSKQSFLKQPESELEASDISAPEVEIVSGATQAEVVVDEVAKIQEVDERLTPQGTLEIKRNETPIGMVYQSHITPIIPEVNPSKATLSEAYLAAFSSEDHEVERLIMTNIARTNRLLGDINTGALLGGFMKMARKLGPQTTLESMTQTLKSNGLDSLSSLGYSIFEKISFGSSKDRTNMTFGHNGDMRIAVVDPEKKIRWSSQPNELNQVSAGRVELHAGSVVIQATTAFWEAVESPKARALLSPIDEYGRIKSAAVRHRDFVRGIGLYGRTIKFWHQIKNGEVEKAIKSVYDYVRLERRQDLSVSVLVLANASSTDEE